MTAPLPVNDRAGAAGPASTVVPQRARQPSLRLHLLAWVLASLTLVWAAYMVAGWKTGVHEAQELTDGQLVSVSALLLSQPHTEFVAPRVVSGGAGAGDRSLVGGAAQHQHDYQQSLSVWIWDRAGQVLAHTGDAPEPGFDQAQGFSTLRLGQPASSWRAFARWDEAHSRKIMVLLSQTERDELAWDIAEQMAMPGLWLLPVVALVLGWAIRRGLRPLVALGRAVRTMDVHASQPLQGAARVRHLELSAVVEAIESLVARYQAALTRERELAGELAHELRTPLASLTLQASRLRGGPEGGPGGESSETLGAAERAEVLARIERDALQAGEVMRHMLALARASQAQMDEHAQPVDVTALARSLLAECAPAALDAGHELALLEQGALVVHGHPLLLELALRNLVENAVSHAAPGALIEVQVDAAQRWVQVCDDGAANRLAPMPAKLPQARMGLGLGLGRRVVEKIAGLHGARLSRLPSPIGSGRCDRLSFGGEPDAAA